MFKKKKTHRFKFVGYIGSNKIYLVSCGATGGEFSTILWINEKVKRNYCPCCKERIEKR